MRFFTRCCECTCPASVAPSVGQRPRHRYQTRRIAPAAETLVHIHRVLLAVFKRICRVDGRRKFQFPIQIPCARGAAPHKEGGKAMGSLLFTCPETNQQAPTGVETDVQSLRASWKSTLKIHCPQCGKVHDVS